ncbi:MAG: hypothetical protein AAGA80_08245 [Cyanobacteria bacterium P01_F01_bin.143]
MSYTANIACQQFNIKGAGETIQAVPQLSDVFSPPYHGPRDIPITVHLLKDGDYSYVHFPIVRTGRYAIYLDTAGVFDAMIYNGSNQNTGTGTEISTGQTSVGDCKQFAEAFVSTGEIIFNQNDPQPIAIRLRNQGDECPPTRYIVSLFQE